LRPRSALTLSPPAEDSGGSPALKGCSPLLDLLCYRDSTTEAALWAKERRLTHVFRKILS
jgi:hypothetical protein